MDTGVCVQVIVSLSAVGAMWVRMERRLTRLQDRVQERYRDKKATEQRIERVEKWLPPGAKE